MADGLWVLSPLVLPLPHSWLATALNRRLLHATIRRATHRLGMTGVQVWTFLPNTLEYAVDLAPSLLVYYCVDDWAHAEAMDAPGFVHYFKGPTVDGGRCMSFCLWDSRAEARAAASRPAHARAVALTHQAYAEYRLEFHRVRRTADGFAIQPWDAVGGSADGPVALPAVDPDDGSALGEPDLSPNLAPGLAPS